MFNFRQLITDNYNFIRSEFVIMVAALIAPTVGMMLLIGMLVIADTMSGIYICCSYDEFVYEGLHYS